MDATGRSGLLMVVSGPSGVGKGTVCRELIARHPEVRLSVSATTRSKRAGEEEGVSYFFVTKEKFESMIEQNELIEYAKLFNNNYYGTPRSFVEREIAAGHDIVLEIDYHGALNVKKTWPPPGTAPPTPPQPTGPRWCSTTCARAGPAARTSSAAPINNFLKVFLCILIFSEL